MSWATVGAEIVTLIKAVTDVVDDNVFLRKVGYRNDAEFKERFWDAANSRFIGWEVRCLSDEEGISSYFTGRTAYNTQTIGFIGMKDDNGSNITYTTLDDIMKGIKNKFKVNLTVNSTCEKAEFPIMGEINPIMKQGNWCWQCAIEWIVYERTTFTESIS